MLISATRFVAFRTVRQRLERGERFGDGRDPLRQRPPGARPRIECHAAHADSADGVAGLSEERDGQFGRHRSAMSLLLDRQRLFGVGLEDRRPLGGVEVVGHVLDGPPVELERLAAGRQPSRLAGAGEGRLERLATQARPARSGRTRGSPTPLQLRPELAGPRVVAAAVATAGIVRYSASRRS